MLMTQNSILLRTLSAAALMLAVSMSAHGQVFSRNLVVNGDAEAGSGISCDNDPPLTNIPGWAVTGPFTVARYGGDNFLGPRDYAPLERGSNFFINATGPTQSDAFSTATQTIDLSSAAAEIDAGRVRFYLSGYLGCTCGGAGNSLLKASFLDASGKTLRQAIVTAPVSEEILSNVGVLLRSTTGYLLPNTRKVQLTLDLGKSNSEPQWLAADNVSLSLATEAISGANLVVNGDFEITGAHSSSNSPVAGWNTHIYAEPAPYRNATVGFEDPGPSNRGRLLLSFWGPNSPLRAFQTLDVTLAKELIDGGGVSYELSGWLA